ncbi:MAG: acyl carrier protein [Verrucomicrobia bacterium]|nr:acyl carrier protein [Verrucomicrobiota bacterium]NBY36107.1 acyl carrier protein [Verrucomicrobiota bacterium]
MREVSRSRFQPFRQLPTCLLTSPFTQMKDPKNLEIEVAKLVSEILGETVGSDASRLTVARWDSLKHMEVIFAFEEAYGVRLDEAEMAALSSVKGLAERAMKQA